ncbi:MAG: guanylate kinase [Acidimicrobiia bacterium]
MTDRKRLSSPSSPDSGGRLFVISGPSGSGKSTIIRRVLDRTSVEFSVSATTRSPRPGEVDGSHYLFPTPDRFRAMIDEDALLEWAVYNGHYYGTPLGPIEEANRSGRSVLLDIEIQGARQVRNHMPRATMIFIAPPTLTEMERRLRTRGDTSEEDIAERLLIAETQLEEAPLLFDHMVINDDLDEAVEKVVSLVTDS